MTNATFIEATPKQIDYLKSLCQARDVEAVIDFAKLDDAIEANELSKDLASTFIGMALKCPLRSVQDPSRVRNVRIEQDGMYKMDGAIYKVQVAVHGSGRLYAKRLVIEPSTEHNARIYFEYAAGVVYKLTAAMRMSLDEAKEFGALYGTCCVCGRTLTDEVSIANGIGPVCARKFF